MKYNIIFILFFVEISKIYTQNDTKRDYVWLFGYQYDKRNNPNERIITTFDFNDKPMKMSETKALNEITGTAVSICDEQGQLLIYADGCSIKNSLHVIIAGGEKTTNDGIIGEYGWMPDSYCPDNFPDMNWGFILPYPNNKTKYALIHQLSNIDTKIGVAVHSLRYAMIDMAMNNGKGKVESKDNILIPDTLISGHLAAVRHANGRDWWLLMNKIRTNKYYKLRLSPQGFSKPTTQSIGSNITKEGDGAGQSVFSPDGTKFASYDNINGLYLYDFDRCSGNMSNFFSIPPLAPIGESLASGVAFSSNNRYLYIVTFYRIFQFDLKAKNIESSKQLVAEYDGFGFDNIPLLNATFFHQASLAPDGKIYVSAVGGKKYLHIIHKPDLAGKACEVQQHAELPSYNFNLIPNFPNFRLGALQSSPCATPTKESELGEQQLFLLYPNPATDVLQIKTDYTDASEFQLFNSIGQLVKIVATAPRIEVSDLLSGIYFYRILGKEGWLQSGKVLVKRE